MEDQESSAQKPTKQGNMESLSKEELINRCKHLLAISKKAKTAKDDMSIELDKMKSEQARIIHALEEERNEAERQTEALQEMVSNLTENKMSLVSKNESIQRQLNVLQNELDSMREFEKALVDEKKNFFIENEKLKMVLEEQKRAVEHLTEDLKRTNSALPSEADSKALVDEVEFLRTQVNQMQHLKEEYKSLLEKNGAMNKQIEDNKIEKENLLTDLDKVENLCNELKAEKIILEEKYSTCDKKCDDFRNEVDENIKLLKEKVSQSELAMTEARQELSDVTECRSKLEKENEDLLCQIESSSRELQKLEDENSRLTASIKDEKENLSQAKCKYEEDIKNLQVQNEVYQKQIKELEVKVEDFGKTSLNSENCDNTSQQNDDQNELNAKNEMLNDFYTSVKQIFDPDDELFSINLLSNRIHSYLNEGKENKEKLNNLNLSVTKLLNLMNEFCSFEFDSNEKTLYSELDRVYLVFNNFFKELDPCLQNWGYEGKELVFMDHLKSVERLYTNFDDSESFSTTADDMNLESLLVITFDIFQDLSQLIRIFSKTFNINVEYLDNICKNCDSFKTLRKLFVVLIQSKVTFDSAFNRWRDDERLNSEKMDSMSSLIEEKDKEIEKGVLVEKTLKEEINGLMKEISSQKDEINQLVEKCDQLTNDLRVKEDEITSEKEKHEGELQEFHNLKQKYEEIEKEFKESQDQIEKLSIHVEKSEQSDELFNTKELLTIEISHLKECIAEYQSKEIIYSEKDVELDKLISDNKALHLKFDSSVHNYNKTLEELEKTKSEHELSRSENSKFQEEIQTLNLSLKSKDDEVQSIRLKADEVNAEYEELKQKFESVRNKLTESENNLELSQDQISQFKKKLEFLEEEKSSLEAEIENLNKEINVFKNTKDDKEKLDQDMQSLLEERAYLISKREELEGKLIKMEEESGSVSKLITEERDKLKDEVISLKEELNKHSTQCNSVIDELEQIKETNKEYNEKMKLLDEELSQAMKSKDDALLEVENLRKDLESLKTQNEIASEEIDSLRLKLDSSENETKKLSEILETTKKELELVDNENKQLKMEVKCIESNVKSFKYDESEKSDVADKSKEELDPNQTGSNTHNSEIISELNAMNEVIRVRGEKISVLESSICEKEEKISALESQISDMKNQLENNESTPATTHGSSDTTVVSIGTATCEDNGQPSTEDHVPKTLCPTSDNQSEVASTSTYSKVEESHRMKDMEDTFEEKYMKLKNLAIKLKKKLADQTNEMKILEETKHKLQSEKDELTKKGNMSSGKTIQALQNEIDKLQDSMDVSVKKNKELDKQLLQTASEAADLKGKLAETREENVILNVKVKELEKNLVREQDYRDCEVKLNEMKLELGGKEERIVQLERLSTENEAALISSTHQSHQWKEKAENADRLEKCLKDCKEELSESNLRHESILSEKKIAENRVEALNQEVEHLKLTMSKLGADSASTQAKLMKEKEAAEIKVEALEEKLKEDEKIRIQIQHELDTLKSEFEGYKVRAQSVLRSKAKHSQGDFESLEDENERLNSELDSYRLKNHQLQDELISSKTQLEFVTKEKNQISVRLNTLAKDVSSRDADHQKALNAVQATLNAKTNEHRKAVADLTSQSAAIDHNLKLQIESQKESFMMQIKDLERQVATKDEKLQQLSQSPSVENSASGVSTKPKATQLHPSRGSLCRSKHTVVVQSRKDSSEDQVFEVDHLVREDADGSELVECPVNHSPPLQRSYGTMSLEELLNSPTIPEYPVSSPVDDVESVITDFSTKEISEIQSKFSSSLVRIQQLTSLLSESEAENAKLIELSDKLKEEIRRASRNIDREKHLENNEYIKNVLFKFATLPSGDEKFRLIPVLKTLLQLSPEEVTKMTVIAKGSDSSQGGQSWGGYLHMWSNR